jgi:hypothetical protein
MEKRREGGRETWKDEVVESWNDGKITRLND